MTADFQQILIEKAREQSGHNLCGFRKELSRVMYWSMSTTYKKVRGSVPLHLWEVLAIARHYRISLDQVFEVAKQMYA